jgi:hypothetical protein
MTPSPVTTHPSSLVEVAHNGSSFSSFQLLSSFFSFPTFASRSLSNFFLVFFLRLPSLYVFSAFWYYYSQVTPIPCFEDWSGVPFGIVDRTVECKLSVSLFSKSLGTIVQFSISFHATHSRLKLVQVNPLRKDNLKLSFRHRRSPNGM